MQSLHQTYQHWTLSVDEHDFLWLTFDQSGSSVNTLNEQTLGEFDEILHQWAQQSTLKGLIIQSGKKKGFIAGADIAQFKNLQSEEEAFALITRGQEIFNRLAEFPVPTLALIEGFCMGGGLELALACQYRIAENSSKTKLSLPEVKLGIHPGWGGTVRLPKLVGSFKAMDMILPGRNVTAKEAKKWDWLMRPFLKDY